MAYKLVYKFPSVYEEKLRDICEILPKLKDDKSVNYILKICLTNLMAELICQRDLECLNG